MGDGWNKITRRVRRIFGAGSKEERPKKLSASQIIRPEESVPQHGKLAPPSTTRRTRRPEKPKEGVTVTETPWGVVHVQFHNECFEKLKQPAEDKVDGDTVRVRDPVTRRLSRKKLTDGMKKTTGFYHPDGTLIDHQEEDW